MKLSLVQPNFRQGGSAFSGYWLPYSVGCVYSYSAQSPEFKDKLDDEECISDFWENLMNKVEDESADC